MRRETFETPGKLRLSVRVPSGRIDLDAVEGTETVVELEANPELEQEARIELRPRGEGHEVVVVVEERSGFLRRNQNDVRVRVTLPLEADIEISTASADVEGRGQFGALEIQSASGDIGFDQVGKDADVNSASGDIKLARVEGAIAVNTASGDLDVGYLGADGKVRAASGDISIDEAAASLKIQTASGDMQIGSVREGDVTLQSASGDIAVGVKKGSKVWIDARSMSGETSSDLEVSDTPSDGNGPLVEIRATALSGDVTVKRA
ncbi:MAG TPA: DUF4097 family beta strand repeat-containing protein [Gaiellaceae bacterium]|nr:DUF4097 family beta strand repeat-containing protein [Gaiellaceae bacterium]